MDIQRAKELLTALADGLDPLTGEVLPSDHVCNKGDIGARSALRAGSIASVAEEASPGEHRKPWTEKADQELCSLV